MLIGKSTANSKKKINLSVSCWSRICSRIWEADKQSLALEDNRPSLNLVLLTALLFHAHVCLEDKALVYCTWFTTKTTGKDLIASDMMKPLQWACISVGSIYIWDIPKHFWKPSVAHSIGSLPFCSPFGRTIR